MGRLNSTSRRASPGLGTTYEGGDPALIERVLPIVDYLEVTPDTLVRARDGLTFDEQAMMELENAQRHVPVIIHGIGLSIGSHDSWNEQYLRLLDEFLSRIDATWHSEHLGYTMVDGEHMGTMLALPKTHEMLDVVCDRIEKMQKRYARPFLLENIVHLLPEYPGDFTEAGFLNELSARTGCGLIIDAYNLECDAQNYGFDVGEFCRELDWSPVSELHLAGGVEREGFWLDVHSNVTKASTLALADTLLSHCDGACQVVTFELLREAVPVLGHDAIVDELARLKRWLTR